MSSETIDLTEIAPNPCSTILKLPFNINQERVLLERQLHYFKKQKEASESLFDKFYKKSNDDLLQAIEDFVDSSMHIDRNSLFPEDDFNLIHVANIVLGMQVSDHATTIRMIEKQLSGRSSKLKIARISPDITRKTQLMNFVNMLREVPNLLIIIERTESFDDLLLTTLVIALRQRLIEKSIEKVMILFCVAGSSKLFQDSTHLDVSRYTREPKVIYKQTYCEILTLQECLVANEEVDVKFGPEVIETISSNVSSRDASITNFRYLFHSALFDHYHNSRSLIGVPRDQLLNLLESQKSFMELVRDLRSLGSERKNGGKPVRLNPKDLDELASYCNQQVNYLRSYNLFLQTQMSQYFELLRDETKLGRCTDLVDIYKEFKKSNDLSHSEMFVNAITGLKNYPAKNLLSRIESSERKYKKLPKVIDASSDVHHILMAYKGDLEATSDDKSIVTALIQDLLRHSQLIKNPLKQPLNEAIYFNKSPTLRLRAIPASRVDCRSFYYDDKLPFNIIYGMIHNGPGEILVNDLYGDFKQRFEELNQQLVSYRPSDVRIKTSSKRGVKRKSEPATKPEKALDEGLLKAIFLDTLESLKHQGLVKEDVRPNRKGTLKKLAWLL